MASIVSICNLALTNVGKDNIADINEASAEARACKQFYGHVLGTLLQAYPWSFAKKTTALAEVVNSKPNRWQYAYARPSDCLKILRVVDDQFADYLPDNGDGLVFQGGFAFDVEGGVIFTNISPAYLQFTWENTDPSSFPYLFVEAFAWHLTARLVMPMTRDPKIRADAYSVAGATQALAAEADANETRTSSDSPAEAIEARS